MKKLITGLIAVCMVHCAHAQNQYFRHIVTKQWHFNGDKAVPDAQNPDITNSKVDWVYSTIHTDKKGYMNVGYTGSANNDKLVASLFKLDNLGKLVWHKTITTAYKGNTPSYVETGYLKQVIQTPNGYAAIGTYCFAGALKWETLLVEFDENGNYLHPPQVINMPVPPSQGIIERQQGYSLDYLIDNNGDLQFIIGGIYAYDSSGNKNWKAYIAQVQYNSGSSTYAILNNAIVGTLNGTNSNFWGGNYLQKLLVDDHDINNWNNVYACGHKSMTGDNYDIQDLNKNNTQKKLSKKNKDIWYLNLDNTLGIVTDRTYDKTDLSAITYTEVGPVSARNLTTTASEGFYSDLVRKNLYENINDDERGNDMIMTEDGNLVLTALINGIYVRNYGDGNGNLIMENGTGFNTGVSTSPYKRTYYYDEYADGDGYVMKIDPTNGDIMWDNNVGHFSSKDFDLNIVENKCNQNLYVAGSTSDYIDFNNSDLTAVPYYDILAMELDPSGNVQWRSNQTAVEENGVCVFTIDYTADGGFVVGGDNDLNYDDYTITKFAPPCATQIYSQSSFNYYSRDIQYDVTGSELWNTDRKILSQVHVKPGAVLTIQDCTIEFAASDHMYNYHEFQMFYSGVHIGIVVEPGGQLIVERSTLRGIDDCCQEMMWDGIEVQGDPTVPNINPPSPSHGYVRFDDSRMLDALYGLYVAEIDREYVVNPGGATSPIDNVVNDNYSSRYIGTANMGGGFIVANRSTFENCRFSANFQNYNMSSGPFASSAFRECQFISNQELKDPCFYADPDGTGKPTKTFVSAWNVTGISFYGNTFFCDDAVFPDNTERTNGIFGADTKLNVAQVCLVPGGPTGCTTPGPKNIFTNLKSGVEAQNTPGASGLDVSIKSSEFHNVDQPIATVNTIAAIVVDNEIYGTNTLWFGVQMLGCYDYNVSYNRFDVFPGHSFTTNGIAINNAHGNDELVYKNTFDNFDHACLALHTNDGPGITGLQWRCNTFNQGCAHDIGRYSNSYTLNGNTFGVPGTMREHQGDYIYGKTAGNVFNNGCFSTSTRLDRDASVTQNVDYHFSAAGSVYDPGLGITCVSAFYNPINTGLGGSYNDICPDGGSVTNPPDSRMADILTEYDYKISHLSPSDQEYASYVTLRNLEVNDRVRTFITNDDPASAADLLARYERFNEAVRVYMSAGLWQKANGILMQMPSNTKAEQDLTWLLGKAIDLYSQGNSWFDITKQELEKVDEMVAYNNTTGYMAMAISNLVHKKEMAWLLPDIESAGGATALEEAVNNSASTLVSIYPNPTDGVFTLQSSAEGTLSIYTVDGRVINTYKAVAGKTQITLPASLSSGIYVGRFETQDDQVQNIRIVYEP